VIDTLARTGILRILWAPLLVLVVACGDENPTGPSSSLTGTWTLSSVNTASLPFTVRDLGIDRREVLSGVIELRTGDRFASRINLRDTSGGVVSLVGETITGRFVRTGNTLRIMVANDPESRYTATISDGNARITLADEGVQYDFQRTGTAPPPID
jgi:hypothetical protein